MLCWWIIFTICFSSGIESARILGVFPAPSYSHQIVYRPVWIELAKRGHDVTILTTDPVQNLSLPNLRQIDWHDAYKLWNVESLTQDSIFNSFTQIQNMVNMMDNIVNYELEHPEVRNLLKNESEHFDLAIMEYMMPVMFTFSAHFKCPYVGILSMDAPTFGHITMGNPAHPVLYPDLGFHFVPPLTLPQRVVSVLLYILMHFYGRYYYLPREEVKAKKYFGEDIPKMIEIGMNMNMLFLNTNPIFHNIRPLGPRTIPFGGGAHLTPPKPLPEDLKTYLDDAVEGVIYFSLGSNIKSKSISPALKEVFLESFKDLPYKVLWKFDVAVENLPSNVKIAHWVPQQDILRHPNVKLFIMQGGLQSIEEAIHTHIPVVVMPFFADQEANAKQVVNKGLGISIDRNSIDKTVLTSSIMEVITNPRYKANLREISELLTDQPMGGVEKVIWWIEYVLRHKGVHHLKSPRIPVYQYYLLDVFGVVFLFLSIILTLIYFTTRYIKRIFVKVLFKKVKTN